MPRIARLAEGHVMILSAMSRMMRRRIAMLKPDTAMLACAFAWCVIFYLTIGRR